MSDYFRKNGCVERFGGIKRDKDGVPVNKTEQHHKALSDVNNIVNKYRRSGIIEHGNAQEPVYLDCTGIDYRTMMDKLVNVQRSFNRLPAKERLRFANDPALYLMELERLEQEKKMKEVVPHDENKL